MTGPFTAAALQFRVDTGAVPRNAERAFRLLSRAARLGARLCVLPEMWSSGFDYDALSEAAVATRPLLERLRAFAARHGMVVAGSLPERAGGAVYNTLYVVDATGRVAGRYRKAHLFSPAGEHLHFARGRAARVIPTAVGPVGPLVCYDLRFPELARRYFLEGAALLCVSAQWPEARASHWEILNAARAVENQCFVVAANAAGPCGPFRCGGGSRIVSPAGAVLACAGDGEGLAAACLDPADMEAARSKIPCARDRNERAYAAPRRPKTRRGR